MVARNERSIICAKDANDRRPATLSKWRLLSTVSFSKYYRPSNSRKQYRDVSEFTAIVALKKSTRIVLLDRKYKCELSTTFHGMYSQRKLRLVINNIDSTILNSRFLLLKRVIK